MRMIIASFALFLSMVGVAQADIAGRWRTAPGQDGHTADATIYRCQSGYCVRIDNVSGGRFKGFLLKTAISGLRKQGEVYSNGRVSSPRFLTFGGPNAGQARIIQRTADLARLTICVRGGTCETSWIQRLR